MNKPRILTYVSKFRGNISGLESQIYQEYVRLSENNQIIIICEEHDQQKFENIQIVCIKKLSIPKIRGIYKIFSYLFFTFQNRKNYDILYVRTFSLPELISCCIAKFFLKKSLVFLIPGSWILVGNNFKAIIHRYFFKKIVDASDTLILYSKLMLNDFTSMKKNFDYSKIFTIKNAVDHNNFIPRDEPNSNTILYIGRIHPLKNIDEIIHALSLIKKKYTDIKLIIVGSIDSKLYFEELKSLINYLDCKNNVEFLGPIPHNHIFEIYKKSKIFVLMGENEGIPRSILEAMSCGIPVIAASNSGIPDVIINRVNGILVENNNPKILSEKISELLSNSDLRNKIGIEARKTIIEKHNWKDFINNLNQIFTNLNSL